MWAAAKMGRLQLFEKDPTTWEVVEGGARGTMRYTRSGPSFDFVLNAHGLEPELGYSLIYYADPWPGHGLMCLGDGVADEYGNVFIRNSVDTGDLPAEYDENFGVGAKLWLVLNTDVNCDLQQMELWNPTWYLFENELITYESSTRPHGPRPHGPPDRSRIALGLYEILEGDPTDTRGGGELYGCAHIESGVEDSLFVLLRLRYALAETAFDV
jgi:hypothetical protein